uniref:Uncharacterized protein n=1 Tax=Cucumis melo TaxID=3656 RepID=A0A9I9CTX8_CUCME
MPRKEKLLLMPRMGCREYTTANVQYPSTVATLGIGNCRCCHVCMPGITLSTAFPTKLLTSGDVCPTPLGTKPDM